MTRRIIQNKVVMAVIIALASFLTVEAKTVKAADEIYAAGMPDAWPLEYYDKDEKQYRGILPELLEEACRGAGVKLRYVNPSDKDERLALAQNGQIDVMWTYGLPEEALRGAGAAAGAWVLQFEENKEKVSISPAYTDGLPDKTRAALEQAFAGIGREEIEGKYLVYAKEGHKENEQSLANRYIKWVVLAAAAAMFIILPLRLAKRRRQVECLAYQDDITGKDNFAVWKRKYTETIQDGNREHYAVWYLVAGIDTVAQIYGYDEARNALKLISDTCADKIQRTGEAMARFNEFHFVFFVQYTNVGTMKKRLQELCDDVEAAFVREKKKYFMEIHTGIYRLTGADSDPFKSLQYGEIAMEYARSHYQEYELYDEAVEHETISGYAMAHEAIHGIMQDEFVMYMQPMIEFGTGKICGAEALVRWENPGRGLLGPEEFLPVMKKKQLIGKMNMEIFRQGCRFLRENRKEEEQLQLIFNFTVENVGDEQFIEHLQAVAGQYEVNPGQIIIQLNQMVEMSQSQIYVRTIRRLRERGFHVCLSGLELDRVFLEYLDCGINGIKLRHELVRQIERPEGYQVIKSLVELCHDLKLTVICVGVENEKQAALLKQLGCEMASGFYFCYPVSQDVFSGMVAEGQES